MLRRLLLSSLALALGCGEDPASPPLPAPDVPALDAPDDLGLDAPPDAPTPDGGRMDALGDAPGDALVDALVDALGDALVDALGEVVSDADVLATVDSAAPPCARDSECVGFGERGVCDLSAGRCVECVSARDLCPSDQHCDDATHTCVDGCRSDEGCIGARRLRCDTASHTCVTCARDEHCPTGQLCIANACVVGCSISRPCASGALCCSGGCADTQTSLLHCGRCDAACVPAHAEARCADGRCGFSRCVDGFADCDGDAANGCESDLRADPSHCGACATPCVGPPRAVVSCAEGVCEARCESGYDDCDANPVNGCETPLATTLSHCGACGRACAPLNAAAACADGVCGIARCNPGFSDCDGDPATGCEVRSAIDVNHCGGCGVRCPTPAMASAVCAAGVCGMSACATGFGNCDGNPANGCEQALTEDVNHCGACGLRCDPAPHATVGCAASRCVISACEAGFASCDGLVANGCEVDLSASAAHCGSCGNACLTGQSCLSGLCGCPSGQTYCAGACRDLANDSAHCGACGRRCSSSLVCSAGSCAYPQLRFVLEWSGTGDLDLRVRSPLGNDVWSGAPAADGGRLDTNARTAPGPETVYWVGAPPRGYYNVCVSNSGTAFRFNNFTVMVYRGPSLAARFSGTRTSTTASTTCLTGAATYVNRFAY